MTATGGDPLRLLRAMLYVRRFEERCVELYTQTKIRGFLHVSIGQEAVAAGVMEVLTPRDAVVATYREHGHALLKGMSARSVMAEMYGKATGCSRGRGTCTSARRACPRSCSRPSPTPAPRSTGSASTTTRR